MQPNIPQLTVADVGEFGLIDRLATALGPPTNEALVVGIGDDAAAWKPASRCLTVATTDTLVEGIHFNLATTEWEDLGWKALAENISDVAAMGCNPRYALIALGVPAKQAVAELESFYRGMRACGARFGCSVVGGDMVRGDQLTIQVTVIGESLTIRSETDRPLLERTAARPGDVVAVTGPLGGSAGGLQVLTGWADPSPDRQAAERLRIAHRRPMPRVEAGLALVDQGVKCGMDISDGLLADLGHICERSQVDAEVDVAKVPLYPGLEKICGVAAVGLALSGGEDYELLCTAPPDVMEAANELLQARKLGSVTVIGSIVAMTGSEPSVRARAVDGRLIEDAGGWDHFKRSPA